MSSILCAIEKEPQLGYKICAAHVGIRFSTNNRCVSRKAETHEKKLTVGRVADWEAIGQKQLAGEEGEEVVCA